MITKYEKANRGKLLVAVMALAVVLAGAAVIFSDSEVSAAGTDGTIPEDATSATSWDAIANATSGSYKIESTIVAGATIPAGVSVYTTGEGAITVNSTLTISGNLILEDVSDITINSGASIIVDSTASISLDSTMMKGVITVIGSDGYVSINSGTATLSTLTASGMKVSTTVTVNGEATVDVPAITALIPVFELNVTVADKSTITVDEFGVSGDIVIENGGTIVNNGKVALSTNSTITNNGTIINNGKVALSTNSTITNNGTIINNGSINNQSKNFTNNGTVAMSNDATFSGESITGNAITSSITTSNTSTGLQNYIDSDFTIPTGGAYLTQDLTIKSGATLTVPSKAELNLNGYKLIVEGTLAVERNGVVAALPTDAEQGIYLASNGSIENNGVIGTASTGVTVGVWTNSAADEEAGSVELLNVNGVNFSIVKTGVGATATYKLTVSGDVTRASGTTSKDTMTFTINGATVSGDLTTSKDVTLGGEFSVDRNSTVTVNGPLAANVTLKNEATISVNGVFVDSASIIAETAEGIAANEENPTLEETTITNTTTDSVSATGFTVSVSRVQYTDDNGDVMFNQRAYLSGNIDTTAIPNAKPDKDATATIKVAGNIFIAADDTVVLDDVVLATENGLIVVEGTIQNVGENVPEFDFVGAYYSVKAEGATDAVGYITSFDKAMGAISTAEDMTITVSGTANFYYEVTGTYELAMDQNIELKTSSDAYIAIAGSGKITVDDGAYLNPETLKEIEGLLVVMDGGNCTPAAELYDVMSSNDAGDVTYAGFQVVLNNAKSGDVITVTGDADATNVTIPNGVTVVVKGSLTVDRTVTVSEGGKLVLDGGALTIGTDDTTESNKDIPGKLVVNGEADVTEGTVTMVGGSENNKATIDSTGSFIYYQMPDGTYVQANGATYTNADGFTVLTTFSKAVAGAIEAETIDVNVIGTVNDTTDVTLGGANVTVSGKATLGNINVAESKLTVSGGELTATIVGQCGEDGSTGTASIVLNKAVITGVTNQAKVNAQNVNVWTLAFSTVTSGSVEISQGTVVAGNMTGNNTTDAKDTLTVAAGATLVIADGSTVDIDGYNTVSVEGTLSVVGTLNVGETNDVEKFVVSGTMTVDGSATVETITVTGTLTVTNNETTTGTMSISKAIVFGDAESLGATGSVSGTVTLTDTAYALAYPGTTVAKSNFGNEANVYSTEFHINGALYATAYATSSSVAAIGQDGFMDGLKIVGYDTDKVINVPSNWYSDEAMETPLKGDVFNVGAEDAVYIQLTPANAKVQYSVGTGISLYVDGVKVTSGNVPVDLSVGTHQVTATVNPGYTGDVTITFNGQTVSGTFEVTPEMAKTGAPTVVLSATGNISVDTGSTGSSDDGGMGIVEILLIILVVVVVILAIFVVLRMMRS